MPPRKHEDAKKKISLLEDFFFVLS